jgi:hypothetical protein
MKRGLYGAPQWTRNFGIKIDLFVIRNRFEKGCLIHLNKDILYESLAQTFTRGLYAKGVPTLQRGVPSRSLRKQEIGSPSG